MASKALNAGNPDGSKQAVQVHAAAIIQSVDSSAASATVAVSPQRRRNYVQARWQSAAAMLLRQRPKTFLEGNVFTEYGIYIHLAFNSQGTTYL